ncbi:MAG: HAMP domain-containing histidine kinase [Acetatifactor sp.]|nr:HAMP domain-containing histidine kinase [Acetatifactor sp.]
MNRIRNLSVRKSIVLYMLVAVVLSFIPTYFIERTAQRTQEQIWEKYMGEEYWQQIEEYQNSGGSEAAPNVPSITRPVNMEMSDSDRLLSEVCDFLQTYSLLVFACGGIIVAVFFFYKNKLAAPLAELTRATAAIGSQNLDFTINYANRDELGEVCAQFEVMRRQLAENNSRMWKTLEQERALRASIAHDIRSPLTILKGYQEMLLELVPDRQTDAETADAMTDMLKEGMVQIGRMEDFLGSMNQLSALEERKIQLREIRLSELAQQYRKNLEVLAAGRECELCTEEGSAAADVLLRIDVGMVTEVLENLLTNALRYAESKVSVRLSVRDGELYVEVADDGPGFAESAEILTKAYYHANPQDDLTHFGMGLYICRVYCEKLGGRLLLGNENGGGGKAVAVFPC